MKQTIIEKAIKSIKDLQNSTHSSSQKLGFAQAMDILEGYKVLEKQHQGYSEEAMKQFAFNCVAGFLSNEESKLEMGLVEIIMDRNSKKLKAFKKK